MGEPETNDAKTEGADRASRRWCRLRNAIIFVAVVDIWLILDQLAKHLLQDEMVGTLVAGPFGGIFQLTIVHNTGGAWGIFGGSPIPLAIVSIIVCAILIGYLFFYAPTSSPLTTIGIALICAGGIGNTIDRLREGYVLDFIEPTFIDFPVFNIADIGVTIGVILLIAGYFYRISREASRIRQKQAVEAAREKERALERESRERQSILDDDSDEEEIEAMAAQTKAKFEARARHDAEKSDDSSKR